jgi:hypothetical protein
VEYLVEKGYEATYANTVQSSFLVSNVRDALEEVLSKNVRLEYDSLDQFKQLATELHLMNDEKAGVPRTSFNGIVETRPHGNHFLFLTPREL